MKTTQDIQDIQDIQVLPEPEHEYEPIPEEPEPRDYDEDQPDAMTPDEWEEMMDQSEVCVGFDADGVRIFG